jgi:hypothetical protein
MTLDLQSSAIAALPSTHTNLEIALLVPFLELAHHHDELGAQRLEKHVVSSWHFLTLNQHLAGLGRFLTLNQHLLAHKTAPCGLFALAGLGRFLTIIRTLRAWSLRLSICSVRQWFHHWVRRWESHPNFQGHNLASCLLDDDRHKI